MDFGLKEHEGYTGVFTRHQADGALYPNNTRIVKALSEVGDSHPTGSVGTVLGSIKVDDLPTFYFVEWDARPKVAVGILEYKLGPLPA